LENNFKKFASYVNRLHGVINLLKQIFMCRYLKYSFLSGQEVNKDVPGYVGYIFQCESKSVVEDILQGLRSAFIAAHESAR
jgi:hypothetical protein